MKVQQVILAIVFICCCRNVVAQVPTVPEEFCANLCLPIDQGDYKTCGNTFSIVPFEVPLPGVGTEEDMHPAHKKQGYTRCRFALCCTSRQAYEIKRIEEETDDFLSQGMGAYEGEFPHQVRLRMALDNGTSFSCGGTIYNKHHIITANHCVRYKLDPNNKTEKEKTFRADQVTVTAGVTNLDDTKPENKYTVAKVIENSGYIDGDHVALGSDIAVLRLKGEGLDFSNPKIRALRVAPPNFIPDYNRNGIFSGWGRTERNASIDYLLKASLPIHHPYTCQRIADRESDTYFPNPHHICAGGSDSGITAGHGDSGGGLVCPDANNRPIHCGIASYKRCARKCVYPSVFTRVSVFTDNFIAMATRNEMGDSKTLMQTVVVGLFLETQDPNTLHNESLGPQVVSELVPEYLIQLYGAKKDCAAVLVRPQIALTSYSCLADNDFYVTIVHAKTRREIPSFENGGYPGYEELKSENVTKLLKDTIRKFDLGYVILNETVPLENNLPQIGSTNWKDGFEDAWPTNGPELERRNFIPVAKAKCQHAYNFLQTKLSDDQLCVVEKYSGSSFCDRSLGSPLICDGNVCGIASFRGCKYTFPNIYTDVTKLSKGINDHIEYYENKLKERNNPKTE